MFNGIINELFTNEEGKEAEKRLKEIKDKVSAEEYKNAELREKDVLDKAKQARNTNDSI